MGQRIITIMLNPLAHLNDQLEVCTGLEAPCTIYTIPKE